MPLIYIFSLVSFQDYTIAAGGQGSFLIQFRFLLSFAGGFGKIYE
jgi:hypothetical protein